MFVKRAALFAIALFSSRFALAHTVWMGDFETEDLSQWSGTQAVSPSRLELVSSPVRQGTKALKVTVRQGDDPIGASGNRNELVYQSREAPGSEYFYGWQTLFPDTFPSAEAWQLFVQWHHSGCCGSPPLEMYVVGEEMRLRASGRILWTAPLVRGRWHDFVLHVKWSPLPEQGFVELYHDGRLVLPLRRAATMFSGESNYLKMGLYRDSSIRPEGVVFHDGMVQATSLADLLPLAGLPQAGEAEGPTLPALPEIDSPSQVDSPGSGAEPEGELRYAEAGLYPVGCSHVAFPWLAAAPISALALRRGRPKR